ncbi:MAG TPA: NAD+ synthase [Phycisphaerae bacterium]|nr:NAD+ synthase [Phycisphaerae bacterium]
MIVGLAQCNPVVGDLAGNSKRILEFAEKCRAADVVLFSELTLCGYPPKDLILKPQFVEQMGRALDDLAKKAAGGPALLVGFVRRRPVTVGRDLQNAMALLQGGKIVAEFYKSLLPTYDVFDEHRYFEPARESRTALFNCRGRQTRIGVTICEDLWNDKAVMGKRLYERNPIEEIAREAPEVVFNASASPFVVEKQPFRERLMSTQAAEYGIPIVYVNQVGGNDELIFDGESCVFGADGRLFARAKAFEEDALIVDLSAPQTARRETSPARLESVWKALVLGTRDYVRKCGFRDVVLGLSGGIDSALTACIAVEAVGADHVHGVAMPSRYSSDHSIEDARILAANLGIEFRIAPIQSMHEAFEKGLAPLFAGREPDATEENVQARIRGNLLMALSNKFGWLLLTTGNKSELSVGYCTLYGDMCGGLAVISDVPKTMVYELSRWYNEREGRAVIPESSITKLPSAELRPDQHDQQTLPPYDVLDAIIFRYIEQEKSAEEIIAEGFDPKIVKDVARKIDLNEYKRKQAATGLKVTSRAFGVGRRMPIAARVT